MLLNATGKCVIVYTVQCIMFTYIVLIREVSERL